MNGQEKERIVGDKTIKKLDVSVVNKIAAGEIIIQPCNALKELIENSIDANSTMIDILVKEGGTKLLQISDNGLGIKRSDMEMLCERFATSKLLKFEDLESISTYGFRGEALASISHISRLSVITKTKDSPLAYKAFYTNGKLCGPNFKPATTNTEPKPVAGTNGSLIIVEDMFYNVPSRIRALKSKNEEFVKILDVVTRYAIHSKGVGFNCKKFADSSQSISIRPQLTLKERIRTVFGISVANELIEFNIDGNNNLDSDTETLFNKFGLKNVTGAITNTNYNNKKKIQPIFFINHRLVSCDPLKKTLLAMYNFFIPKGNQPFIYLSLEITPENVDVNIHPTKQEVRFLHEEEIIDVIREQVYDLLSNVDTSRKFTTQSVFLNKSSDRMNNSRDDPKLKTYRQENKFVRIDSNQSKISPYLTIETNVQSDARNSNDTKKNAGGHIPNMRASLNITEKKRNDMSLDSILSLKEELTEKVDSSLTNIFTNASYIGIVDEHRRLCCFQYDVKLFICSYAAILSEFYYQVALTEFCNYGEILATQDIILEDILEPLYSVRTDLVSKDEVISNIYSMKDMFEEYFQMKFDILSDGKHKLSSLPMLFKDIVPSFSKLPHFVYRLGSHIDYDDEKECLRGIMKQIALWHVPETIGSNSPQGEELDAIDNNKRNELNQILENIIFPNLKSRFVATSDIMKDVIQIADLPGLYRVFERC
ncbi:uncharacterized protein PRCAT00000401001 [Priceomyces carsonii]|uniref:uncharacterized protein n=1 Tax=Priceomyces carsonii TaxID=28549 RepID=UPI002ED9C7CB|nr:unnamed protein product [Priceomyces carsonii]